MKRLGGRIRHSRNVEFWLQGPVSLIAGQQLYGSIVAKVHGRFEEGMGFQPCTLWQSPYAQDGSFDDAFGVYHEGKLQWNWEGTCSEEVKKLRSNLSPLPLPGSARGVLWKLEQYANRRSMCQAKAMSG